MGWMALLDENDKEIGMVGDQGWDLAADFVDEFRKLYKKCWKRLPTEDEITQSVLFVFNNEDVSDEQ
jgi:hypothetical protein